MKNVSALLVVLAMTCSLSCNRAAPAGTSGKPTVALVLKTLKRFVTDGVLAQGPSEQSGRAQRALHEVKESEDAEEAQLAVKQKRKARFRGR